MKKSVFVNKCLRLGYMGASLLSLLTCPVLADDEVTNWSGAYAGVHGGGVWDKFHDGGAAAGPTGHDSSWLGGAQIGNNWQVDHMVVGVEGDGSLFDLRSSNPSSSFNEQYMLTARGRLGFSMNRLLPYITAGAGFTDVLSKAPGQGSAERFHTGAVYGGGVDIMMDKWAGDWASSGKWMGRIEYLHVDVPKENEGIGTTTVRGGSNNDIVRVALNYKF